MNNILDKFSSHIKKINNVYVPINDNLNYKIITLKNKLQIFFIETKDSNISSATMYVGVGNIDNPKDIDGMAHYLEHMLFMGSDKYQGGTYFQNQVANKGGMTNAYTTDNHTQYFFSASEDFIDLLKIFSRFFIKPLFDVKYVEKEVSAVDSEHKKNIGSDGWRTTNLSNLFFIDGINDRFSTGTKESLLGDAVNSDPNILRDRLIQFYETYYSSDKMILFISCKSINKKLVDIISHMFESVPLRTLTHNDDTARVRMTDKCYELIKIKTINESNYLVIKWLIDESNRYTDNICNTSYDIVTHILGHEGRGSLYEILAKTGMIIDLSAGVESSFERNCMFSIQVKLTQNGYDNMEDILYIIDAYIKYLTPNGSASHDENINKIFSDFYDEIIKLTLLYMTTIDNSDGLSLCQRYSDIYNTKKIDLRYVPISGILIGSKINCEKHFENTLKSMRLETAKVILTSFLLDESELPLVDKYYGTLYDHVQVPIDSNMQEKLLKVKFMYPEYNMYIPESKNMQLIDTIKEYDSTYCSIKSKNDNIYFVKRGNVFNTYTITGYISIYLTELKDVEFTKYVALLLYLIYIKKIKQTESYMMKSAKFMINILPDKNRISIGLDGYDCDLGIVYDF